MSRRGWRRRRSCWRTLQNVERVHAPFELTNFNRTAAPGDTVELVAGLGPLARIVALLPDMPLLKRYPKFNFAAPDDTDGLMAVRGRLHVLPH